MAASTASRLVPFFCCSALCPARSACSITSRYSLSTSGGTFCPGRSPAPPWMTRTTLPAGRPSFGASLARSTANGSISTTAERTEQLSIFIDRLPLLVFHIPRESDPPRSTNYHRRPSSPPVPFHQSDGTV